MENEKQSYLKRLKEIISVIKEYKLVTNMTPATLRKAFESLGPTFIKMGQIMADREDLLDNNYCAEFRKLRSQVTPMDSYTVKSILKRELKNKYYDFTSISPSPIGSASIAQVHKARLNNKLVVIKIERENIMHSMETDIYLLKKVLKHLPIEKLLKNTVDINAMLDELLESAKKEMDFKNEEKNMLKFKQYNQNIPYISLPEVYHEYTTNNILVMEYIDAPKINDVAQLEYLGYNMGEIASKLAQNYIKQALDDGFYHADPHPDNIKIKANQIVYLDFGMMGTLEEESRKILKKCMENILFRNTEELAHNLLLFGSKADVNVFELEKDLEKLLEVYLTKGIGSIDLKDFAPALISIIQKHQIKIPKDVTLLMRGIIVLEGVLEDIAPEISLLEALKSQYAMTSILDREKLEITLLTLLKNSKDLAKVPSEALKFFKGLNQGNVPLILSESKEQRIQKEKDHTIEVLKTLDIAFIIGMAITSLGTSNKTNILITIFSIGFIITTIGLILLLRKKK